MDTLYVACATCYNNRTLGNCKKSVRGGKKCSSFSRKIWGLVVIFFYHTSSEFANLHMKSEKVLQKCDIFLSHSTQKTTVKISHFFEFSELNLRFSTTVGTTGLVWVLLPLESQL